MAGWQASIVEARMPLRSHFVLFFRRCTYTSLQCYCLQRYLDGTPQMRMLSCYPPLQVKHSMCRIKQVLTERALAVEDPGKRWFYRKIINDT